MIIELDNGNVVNTYPDTDAAAGEWFPDDTIIAQRDGRGREHPAAPLRIIREQPEGWPERAAREWRGNQWVALPELPARQQQAIERAEKRKEARKRPGTDLDIYERVDDLEKRIVALENRGDTVRG